MKRILVAVDDSETSLRAVRLAAEIATATKAELMLAHVLAPPPADLYGLPTPEFQRIQQKVVNDIIAKAAEAARPVRAETKLLTGKPAEALADAAISSDVDLVVVGSRGRGAVARVLLGEHLRPFGPHLRETGPDRSLRAAPMKRVLAAIDGSKHSGRRKPVLVAR